MGNRRRILLEAVLWVFALFLAWVFARQGVSKFSDRSAFSIGFRSIWNWWNGSPSGMTAKVNTGACLKMTVMAAEAEPGLVVDCPYCDHAWLADPKWIAGPCERCGRMVYRYADPRHD